MNVEIWSDVVCRCVIGKRRFERAVAYFAHPDEIEVTWRSFELDPTPRAAQWTLPNSGPQVRHVGRPDGPGRPADDRSAADDGLEYRLDLGRAVTPSTPTGRFTWPRSRAAGGDEGAPAARYWAEGCRSPEGTPSSSWPPRRASPAQVRPSSRGTTTPMRCGPMSCGPPKNASRRALPPRRRQVRGPRRPVPRDAAAACSVLTTRQASSRPLPSRQPTATPKRAATATPARSAKGPLVRVNLRFRLVGNVDEGGFLIPGWRVPREPARFAGRWSRPILAGPGWDAPRRSLPAAQPPSVPWPSCSAP